MNRKTFALPRVRRACYDKPHRCPGWAGGGFRYPKKDVCDNGFIPYTESKLDAWKVKRCATCGTIRLPIITKWLDPTWIAFIVERHIDELRHKLDRLRMERKER